MIAFMVTEGMAVLQTMFVENIMDLDELISTEYGEVSIREVEGRIRLAMFGTAFIICLSFNRTSCWIDLLVGTNVCSLMSVEGWCEEFAPEIILAIYHAMKSNNLVFSVEDKSTEPSAAYELKITDVDGVILGDNSPFLRTWNISVNLAGRNALA